MANVNINKDLILDMVYPIGSIYMSIHSTSPATLFGGTWEPIYAKFLLGATPSAHGESIDSIMTGLGLSWSSSGYWYWPINGTRYRTNNGAAMGEAGHTLTVGEMPAHTHVGKEYGYGNSAWNLQPGRNVLSHKSNIPNATEHTYENVTNAYLFNGAESNSTGGGQAHNNLPPYLAVHMWKRVA